MLPIGPLMMEHRLIERMVKLMKEELDRISEAKKVDPYFVETSIDFLRTYADRCHHGKEEDILFRDLAKKKLAEEHRRIMLELIDEHVYARRTVGSLENAKDEYVRGNVESLRDVVRLLKELVEFYPRHIEKEDKQFFYPCMDYLTRQEQDYMLQEFWEFDRKLIHEKYQNVVEKIEKLRVGKMAKWRCRICGYVYDPERGDPDGFVRPGTPFEEIPEGWRCPVCNAPKDAFDKVG